MHEKYIGRGTKGKINSNVMGLVSIFDGNIVELLRLNEGSNKVYVFITDMDKYTQNLPQFWQCLSVEEQKQAKRYYASLLTDRYITSHAILRHILSCYTKELPQNLEFIHNKYEKPFLKKEKNIQFNMSHSHNIVCYIIAVNYKVGIDIERYDDTLDIMELLDLIFTPQEVKFFETFAYKTKIETFYSIWTKKEASVKAIGEGVSYPINTIEILTLLPNNKIILTSVDNDLEEELYNYTLEVPLNYFGSIAINNKINEIVYVTVDNQQGIFDNIICLSPV